MLTARVFKWLFAALVLAVISITVIAPNLKSFLATAIFGKPVGDFSNESAQTRFMSYATTIAPLSRLEIAKLNQVEIFDRASSLKIFWDKFDLPNVVVRATVPVEYRYYVDLNAEWKIELTDQALTISAPALTPGTPSPDISNLRFEVREGSFFRDERGVARQLQAELTSLLEQRARQSMTLVRETARTQVSEVAKKWLQSESKNVTVTVTVHFADEQPTASLTH
jgi:hypothetical protein